ncbi:MAG: hypothetical protein L0220_03060 [Acidobacteria bacterium]|nr:hypothetical protein [Acidobacteriota bacterium]
MPGKITVWIDGSQFDAESAVFEMVTQKDHACMPVLQSLTTSVRCRVDLNNDKNFTFNHIKKLFDLGNVPTRDKIKECKIEFWKDESKKDVICSYKFKGWVSHFRTSNVGDENGNKHYNHVLDFSLTPVINKENYQEITLGN